MPVIVLLSWRSICAICGRSSPLLIRSIRGTESSLLPSVPSVQSVGQKVPSCHPFHPFHPWDRKFPPSIRSIRSIRGTESSLLQIRSICLICGRSFPFSATSILQNPLFLPPPLPKICKYQKFFVSLHRISPTGQSGGLTIACTRANRAIYGGSSVQS